MFFVFSLVNTKATEKLFDLLKEWCGDHLDETVVLGVWLFCDSFCKGKGASISTWLLPFGVISQKFYCLGEASVSPYRELPRRKRARFCCGSA